MSANNELRVAEDPWMQMLMILAVVSGVFTALKYGPEFRRPGQAAPPAPVAPGTSAPVGGPAAPAQRAGPWVVDARGGPDVQFTTLGAAVAAARDGDSIVVRPGAYSESVSISKSLVLTGLGTSASQVQLTSQGGRTLSISAGRVFLKTLTVTNTGGGAAVEVTGGSAVLEQVTAGASGEAALVRDAELEASNSTLEGRIGLAVLGRSRATLTRVTVSAREAGVRVDGMGDVRIESAQLKASLGSAVDAGQFGKVRLTDSALSGSGGAAVLVKSGAEVRILRSKISENRGCGVSIDGASAFVERVRFTRQRCGVGFLGPGTLETLDSEYSELELGPLAIKPGREREVTVRGSGNIGLVIPGR